MSGSPHASTQHRMVMTPVVGALQFLDLIDAVQLDCCVNVN